MAYEIYQSRHKGYEIDNLLDDVVDLNADVTALKTEYDANKVKMSDGTILPLHLVNTYATKTDLSAKADSTQVAADIATATADMATQTQVASDIATATTDMATNASVASAIAAAAYTLPEATTSTLGGVKPDGTTITVDSDGTIHSAGGGTGGGHTILDTNGTAVAQEDKLKFEGMSVTDDSTNGITKVSGIGLNADSIDDIATITPKIPSVVIGDANNYSTSEKIIAKWVDGKPLYQKVFSVSESFAKNTVKVVDSVVVDNSETLVKTFLISTDGSAGSHYIAYPLIAGFTSQNKLRLELGEELNNVIYIVLQYTKTIDA